MFQNTCRNLTVESPCIIMGVEMVSRTSRLQNYSLSVIESLYKANHVFLGSSSQRDLQFEKRLTLQHEAMTQLRLLSYLSMVARECQCILPRQQAQISSKVMETQRLLFAWMKSDEARK